MIILFGSLLVMCSVAGGFIMGGGHMMA